MSALITGIIYGFVLMLSTGPSFFYLIKVGIEKGFRKAASFAAGIFLSDVILLILIFIGLKPLFKNETFQQIFSLSSGLIILIFGVISVIRKDPARQNLTSDAPPVKDMAWYYYIIKGFGINLLNPFTVIMWVGVLGTVSPTSKTEFIQFVIGVLGVIFIADTVKAYLAKLIGKVLTPRAVFITNKVVAVGFIAIGAYFVYLFYNSYTGGTMIEVKIPEI